MLVAIIAVIPASAQARTFRDLVSQIVDIINFTIPVIATAALVAYFYNILVSLAHQDSAEARTKLRTHILWGIVGIFILFTFEAILYMLKEAFLGDPDA